MIEKQRFLNTILQLDNNMPKSLSECEKYGMMSGCNEYCPVFIEGNCELQQELEIKFKENKNG